MVFIQINILFFVSFSMNKTIEKEIPTQTPFRTPKKIESYKIRTNIKLEENPPKLNSFNLKQQKKIYQLKTFSRVRNTFQGDIFFSSRDVSAFLIIINVNTRKAYARLLNNVQIERYIDVETQKEVINLSYSRKQRKTITSIIDAFNIILTETKINVLSFDGEPAVQSKEFQKYLISNKIEFTSVIKNYHTSLSIVNRFCRTLRDMAFNMKMEIITQEDIDELLNIYNNVRHESLTLLFHKDSSLKERFSDGIAPNDMNRELEELYVKACSDYNLSVLLMDDFEIEIGTKVRIFNTTNKMEKKRSKLSQDTYEVIGYKKTAIELKNTKTEEITYRTRWQVSIIN